MNIKIVMIGGVILVSVATFFALKSNPSISIENEIAESALVETQEPVISEDPDEEIESKLGTSTIDEEERSLEKEQLEREALESRVSPNADMEKLRETDDLGDDEGQKDLVEKIDEEKKSISQLEVSQAKPISDLKTFRRFLNGTFKGTAKVKIAKKTEVWQIEMSCQYDREGKELKGEISVEISGGSRQGRHNGNGLNQSFYGLSDGSILIYLSPQDYLRITKKNRRRLRGHIFAKDVATGNYTQIGRAELEREP